MNETR